MHFSTHVVLFAAILRFLFLPFKVVSITVDLSLPLRCDVVIYKKVIFEEALQPGVRGFLLLTFPSGFVPSCAVYLLITGSCTFLGRIRDTCGGRAHP